MAEAVVSAECADLASMKLRQMHSPSLGRVLRIQSVQDRDGVGSLPVKANDVLLHPPDARMVGPEPDPLLDPASRCGQVPHVGIDARKLGRFWWTPFVSRMCHQLEGKRFAQAPDIAEQRGLV